MIVINPWSPRHMSLGMILLTALSNVDAGAVSNSCTEPKITIVGAKRWKFFSSQYDIREGHPYEIYCSSDTHRLTLKLDAEHLDASIVNATTIKTITEFKEDNVFLTCETTCTSTNLQVYIDRSSEITRFRCSSLNFETLNCTWETSHRYGTYKLSTTDDVILCSGSVDNRQQQCLWDMSALASDLNDTNTTISLNLQYSNEISAGVQKTLNIDLLKITKLNAPSILYIDSLEPQKALLNLSPYGSPLPFPTKLHLDLEYWFAGIEPQIFFSNTTVATAFEQEFYDLRLPCPGKRYMVRASCRLAKADREYVSEFAYSSFETEPDFNAVLDPICHTADDNPAMMIIEVRELRKLSYQKLRELRKKLKVLKEKTERIRELNSVK